MCIRTFESVRAVMACALFAVFASQCVAQSEGGSSDPGPLRVGTRIIAPFVVEDEDGGLEGLSVALMDRIARNEDRELQWTRYETVEALLDAVRTGEVDAGISAISVTEERESEIDFTHAYFMSGLGIAVGEAGSGNAFVQGVMGLFSPGFWFAVGTLAIVLLVVGFLTWLVERHKNEEEFPRGAHGIASGFWFSAVTMTTVGYGDKAPKSAAGKLVALVWMFTSIIIISFFTGTIASSITSASLQTSIAGPGDLSGNRIGVPAGTASVEALESRGVSPRKSDSLADALSRLESEQLDAVVHDAPLLRHAIRSGEIEGVRVIESEFEIRPYAIAVSEGSQLREPLNRALLTVISEPWWKDTKERWLGE